MELSGDFGRYVSSLEPDEDAVAAAKAAHEKVRERLKADEDTKEAHKDTFLSGSYARHTAIHNINDVDVICIVDIDHTITEPEVVLGWLQGVLSKYYKETRLQGRSIGASAAKGVWLDIVPSTPLSADDGPLWIPDRDAKQWVQSHPKGQITAATSKNKTTNGYYVQTVKLLKAWRDRLPTEKSKPKSYILETLVSRDDRYAIVARTRRCERVGRHSIELRILSWHRHRAADCRPRIFLGQCSQALGDRRL